jgi:ribosomal-protein-alanine N-acetyltransferase
MSRTPAAVIVRRMTSEDVGPVIEIASRLKDAPHWPPSAYLTVLDPEAALPRIALVAEEPENRRLAGFAVASLLPQQAELETIAVTVEHQRSGIARNLFTSLLRELQPGQAIEMVLEVRASNDKALAFYRSLGFAETGRRPRYYNDPAEDAVQMALQMGRSEPTL